MKTYPVTIEASLDEHDRSALEFWCGQDVPRNGRVQIQIRDRTDYDSLLVLLKMLGK